MYSTKATHQPKSLFHQLRPVLVVMVEPTTGTIEQISISMAARAYIKPICIIVTTSAISPAKTTIPAGTAAPMVIIFFPKFLSDSPIAALIIQILTASLKVWASPAKGININDTPIIFTIPMTRFCSWAAPPSRARATCMPAPIRQPTAVTAATGSK